MLPRLLITCLCIVSFHVASGQTGSRPQVWHVTPTADFYISTDTAAVPWQRAPWLVLPHRQGQMHYSTKVKMMYSATGIYMIYACADSVITSTMTEDFMDIYNEDVVEVFFWTDRRTTVYFEYELSPRNVELPIMVPNVNDIFFGWRPWHYEGKRLTQHAASIMHNSAGQVTGWVAAFMIPYALLKPLAKVPPQRGTVWRANMYRIDYDKGDSEWSWKPTKRNFHDYRMFGKIVFD